MKKRAGVWPGFLGDADTAAVIPVSGNVDKMRWAEMNSGTAKRAAGIWSELRRGAGILLDTCGKHTMVVPVTRQPREWVVIFPMDDMVRSAMELRGLADLYEWEKVWMPPEFMDLTPSDRRDLNSILDGRFIVLYDKKVEDEKAKKRAEPKKIGRKMARKK